MVGQPKTIQNTKTNSSASKGAHVVRNQLIPGTEPVPKDTQNSLSEKEVIHSEGAETTIHFEESEGTSANEGAKPIAQLIDYSVFHLQQSKKNSPLQWQNEGSLLMFLMQESPLYKHIVANALVLGSAKGLNPNMPLQVCANEHPSLTNLGTQWK